MRNKYMTALFSVIIILILPVHLSAATRGFYNVISKQGQSIYLYKDYHAIVVGISDYEWWPKLPNAVNDAKEVSERLKKMGFQVKLILNPTSRELKTVLTKMIYKTGREVDRAILFYYAGHGGTETLADGTKMGFIIPKDSPTLEENPMGFGTHAISMKEIEEVSLRIKSKHVLMLFDSCFSGAIFALIRAVPQDITEKSLKPVRQYITAGREDEEVLDESMFKRLFLIGLEGDADLTGDGYITGSEMGMYLSDKVVNYTHRRQHPQYGKINNPDLDRGDFIFIPPEAQARRIKGEDIPSDKFRPSGGTAKLRSQNEQKQSSLVEAKLKELHAKLAASEKNKIKEAIKRKSLEKELKRLKGEKKPISPKQPSPQKTQAKKSPDTSPVSQTQDHIADASKIQEPIKNGLKSPKPSADKEEKVAALQVPKAKPQQNLATLIVTSNVKEAKVYIDKKEISFWASPDEAWIYRGGVPFKSQVIGPGRHEIRVHEYGYEEEVKIVNISPGEILELDVTLFRSLSENGDEDHGGGGGGGGAGM